MFKHAVASQPLPKYLSTDHDPLFRLHRWLANLRVLEIEEVKLVPYTPVSHPFVERLIGTIRREFLDRVFFWNVTDLARKLAEFRDYYNAHRVHRSLDGTTPVQRAGAPPPAPSPTRPIRLAPALSRPVSDARSSLTPTGRARSATAAKSESECLFGALGEIGERGMLIQADSFGERSLRRALTEYVAHFHAERNHQGQRQRLVVSPRFRKTRYGKHPMSREVGRTSTLLRTRSGLTTGRSIF